MNTGSGWVKLHRKLLSWEWYKDSETLHLFIHLILKANHLPGKWQGVEVGRGELVTGRRSLSAETGLSDKSLRTRLARLKNSGEIAIKTASKYSVVTIINYNEYQGADEADGPAEGPAEGPAKGQQRASKGPAKGHKQEGEELKNENKLPPLPPAGGSDAGEEEKGRDDQPPARPLPTAADQPNQAGKKKRVKMVDEGVVFFRSLRPDWITETQWEEIICWRARKKVAMTKRAADNLVEELEKSKNRGYTVDQVLDLLSRKPWSSYEDRFLDNQQMQPAAPVQSVKQDVTAPRPMPDSRELAERLAQERYEADMARNRLENEQKGG